MSDEERKPAGWIVHTTEVREILPVFAEDMPDVDFEEEMPNEDEMERLMFRVMHADSQRVKTTHTDDTEWVLEEQGEPWT